MACAELKELVLNESAVSDRMLRDLTVPRRCTILGQLTSLDLSDCRMLSDAGVATMVGKLRMPLERVNLGNNDGVGEETVIALAAACGGTLRQCFLGRDQGEKGEKSSN
jgi:hypothetical protein